MNMPDKRPKQLIDEMYTEEARLNTFKNWPFSANSKCCAAKMAEAGFFHCPTENEPDLVQCFVCYKELDGWEANDEPWGEHFSHSKICVFAQIHKPQKDLTLSQIFKIEAERIMNKVKRMSAQRIRELNLQSNEIEDFISDTFDLISK